MSTDQDSKEEYANALIEARKNLQFSDEYRVQYDNEMELMNQLEERPSTNTISSLALESSAFSKQIARIPALRNAKFSSPEELQNLLNQRIQMNNEVTHMDSSDALDFKESDSFTLIIDSIFNFSQKSLINVVVLPCFRDGGIDIDKKEIFWDLNRESSIKFITFEGDCMYELHTKEDTENILFFVVLILTLKYEPDNIDIEQVAMTLVPVRKPSGAFLHGTFQCPLYKEGVNLDSLSYLAKTDVWTMIKASGENSKMCLDTGSVIVRLFPKQMKEVYPVANETELINTLLMPKDTKGISIFYKSKKEKAMEHKVKVEELIPEDYVGQEVVASDEIYLGKLFESESSKEGKTNGENNDKEEDSDDKKSEENKNKNEDEEDNKSKKTED